MRCHQAVVAHAFNSSAGGWGRGRGRTGRRISAFEDSLGYKMNSRTASTTKRNLSRETKKQHQQKKRNAALLFSLKSSSKTETIL